MLASTIPQQPSTSKRKISTFLAYQAAGLGYMAIREDYYEVNWWYVVIAFILGGIARAKRQEYKLEVQAFRNQMAAFILKNPDWGSFWLYLRPFRVTGNVQLPNKQRDQGPLTPWYHEGDVKVEFEELLQDAIAKIYHDNMFLVGLGKPGEAIGAGRVSSESWKEDVEKLALKASLILVVPGTTENVQWEMNLLRSMNVLDRTVFILPPVTDETTRQLRADALEALKPMELQGLDDVGNSGALVRSGQKIVTFRFLSDYGIAAALEKIAP